jgi:HEAT repeat protein
MDELVARAGTGGSSPSFRPDTVCVCRDFKNVDVMSTLPTILSNLEDESRTVRADSIQTLRQFIDRQHFSGKDAAPELVVPRLITRREDDYSYTRNAVQALQSYADKAVTAVPYLQQRLDDSDEQVRRLAVGALKAIEKTVAPPESNDK